MNTIKTRVVFFCCLLALLFSSSLKTFGVNIRILGKAGATIQNGQIKVCPGFAFNTCAVIEITWQDIWEWITSKGDAETGVLNESPPVTISLVKEDAEVPYAYIKCKIVRIDPSLLQGDDPNEIQGDQIDFMMY